MTNPSPRPALRRAPDAHIHPALALGAVTIVDLRETGATPPRVEPDFEVVDVSVTAAEPAARKSAGTKKFNGKKSGKKSSAGTKKSSGKNKKIEKKAAGKKETARRKSDGKPTGKISKKGRKRDLADRIDVRREVSPEVRRRLRSGAKARGTSVDEVVTSVLEGWSPS